MIRSRKLSSARWQARYKDPLGKLRTLGTFPTKKEADSLLRSFAREDEERALPF